MGLFDRIKEFTKPLRSLFKTRTAVNNNAVAKLEEVRTVVANIQEAREGVKAALANHASEQVGFQQRQAALKKQQIRAQLDKMTPAEKDALRQRGEIKKQQKEREESMQRTKAVLAFASMSENPAAQAIMYNNAVPRAPGHKVEPKGAAK